MRVAASRMAGALRLVSIERGHDPKRSRHAVRWRRRPARRRDGQGDRAGRALVPRHPGVISALGCIIADMRHDLVRTVNRPLDGLDSAALAAQIAATTAAGAVLGGGGMIERIDAVRARHVLYRPDPHRRGAAGRAGRRRTAHDAIVARRSRPPTRAFGRLLVGIPVRVLTLRVAVIGRRPARPRVLRPAGAALAGRAWRAPVWFDGGWHDTAIYDRLALPVGAP